jgi:NAD(P)-dependent dehydrogenase (short-subunit alcohol dehydrogenase family)
MPARRKQDAAPPIYPGMRNKVALVTGGSSGIGLATARAFARQGARVVIASRKESAAKTALKALAEDADVRWHATDVTNGKSVARLIDSVMVRTASWITRSTMPAAADAWRRLRQCRKRSGARQSTDTSRPHSCA